MIKAQKIKAIMKKQDVRSGPPQSEPVDSQGLNASTLRAMAKEACQFYDEYRKTNPLPPNLIMRKPSLHKGRTQRNGNTRIIPLPRPSTITDTPPNEPFY